MIIYSHHLDFPHPHFRNIFGTDGATWQPSAAPWIGAGGAWGRHDRSAEDTTRLLLPLWCGAQGFNETDGAPNGMGFSTGQKLWDVYNLSISASDFAGPCTVSHRYLDQLWAISGWWWLEPWNFITFPSYWECHHPNISEVHHFSEGLGQPPTRYGPCRL